MPNDNNIIAITAKNIAIVWKLLNRSFKKINASVIAINGNM